MSSWRPSAAAEHPNLLHTATVPDPVSLEGPPGRTELTMTRVHPPEVVNCPWPRPVLVTRCAVAR